MGQTELFLPESAEYVSGIIFIFDEMKLTSTEFTLNEKGGIISTKWEKTTCFTCFNQLAK